MHALLSTVNRRLTGIFRIDSHAAALYLCVETIKTPSGKRRVDHVTRATSAMTHGMNTLIEHIT